MNPPFISTDEQYEGAKGTITGWGRFNTKTKKTSTVLKEFTGPLLNTSSCVVSWNKFPGINAKLDQHICLDVNMGTPCHVSKQAPCRGPAR